jgi:hypothetical protein
VLHAVVHGQREDDEGTTGDEVEQEVPAVENRLVVEQEGQRCGRVAVGVAKPWGSR